MDWATVAAERGALADDLAGLTDEQWQTPSLCAGWSVREVLAHMSGTASTTPMTFFVGLARSGFRFDRFINRQLRAGLGADPEETLAIFRSRQHSTTAPPGPKVSWLGEVIVHSEDIRRPLAIAHDYPETAVREVLDFYAGSNLVLGTKKRIDGLNLIASDTDYSHGAGGRVEGPLLSLLLAASGRKQACDDLTGPGVSILRARD